MKKKVIITAEKSGYTSNLIAQNFNAKKTYTPGVVVTDLENSSFAYATDSIIDTADGHFNLYEDEGDNFNQKNSKFRFIPFNWNERIQTLTFGKREGSFKGMLNKRTIQID
jgi:lipopolysaccharide export LptBFGC system permease protein LptF